MARYYIDGDGNRLKHKKFKDMPDAWIECKDEDDEDTCDERYIDERKLFVRCGRFALTKKQGKMLCRKHLAAI